jgi:hypothetical protein
MDGDWSLDLEHVTSLSLVCVCVCVCVQTSAAVLPKRCAAVVVCSNHGVACTSIAQYERLPTPITSAVNKWSLPHSPMSHCHTVLCYPTRQAAITVHDSGADPNHAFCHTTLQAGFTGTSSSLLSTFFSFAHSSPAV